VPPSIDLSLLSNISCWSIIQKVHCSPLFLKESKAIDVHAQIQALFHPCTTGTIFHLSLTVLSALGYYLLFWFKGWALHFLVKVHLLHYTRWLHPNEKVIGLSPSMSTFPSCFLFICTAAEWSLPLSLTATDGIWCWFLLSRLLRCFTSPAYSWFVINRGRMLQLESSKPLDMLFAACSALYR